MERGHRICPLRPTAVSGLLRKIPKYIAVAIFDTPPPPPDKKFWFRLVFHTSLDKAFQGTVVNRALPSLHCGSFEITVTVLSILKMNVV